MSIEILKALIIAYYREWRVGVYGSMVTSGCMEGVWGRQK